MIQIVNWLLTRKCNLKCDYCRIVRNYQDKPEMYPNLEHYYKKEMDTKTVINALNNFKRHNTNIFHVFYGGEPTLRNDLAQIVEHCNENDIEYTVISNNVKETRPFIERLIGGVSRLKGFTSSIDPILVDPSNGSHGCNDDIFKKTTEGYLGLKNLYEYGYVDDVVAEITVTRLNQHLLLPLVQKLSDDGIYSSITFVDIAKSPAYDFSNVTDPYELVKPSFELAKTFEKILSDNNLLVHMKELLPVIFDHLPSDYDCNLENKVHNVTVDADGSMRLCLRIRGEVTPTVHVNDLFEDSSFLNGVTKEYYDLMCIDKKRLCKLCNHTCMMMSNATVYNEINVEKLVHADRRHVKLS